MGGLPVQNRRWLWPALLLMILALYALAGRDARATADPAAIDITGKVYVPHVRVPAPPPLLGVVPYVAGFENKTIMVITHAGDERLFVANREGKVWVVFPNGTVSAEPFLDISHLVDHEANFEQGLLGLAFHPDYPATPYFYISYTSSAHVNIIRGEVSPTNPNQAIKDVVRIITIRKPDGAGGPSPVHNGGDLKFGPDGYLYIPVGDGGPDPYDPFGVPGDPHNHSQRRDSLFGAILRIDPNPDRGLPQDCGVRDGFYSVPHSNPWLNDNGCDEIWATGLRNPWRMSFDSLTGELYIADVGEWLFEEINYLPANSGGGANFGWHCWEGTTDYTTIHPSLAGNCDDDVEFTFPVAQYNHSQGECSVIGGYVYRGAKHPALYGRYFFADWCSGRMWTMTRMDGQWQVASAGSTTPILHFTTFGEDIHGEIYAGSYENGMLFKVVVR